MLTDLVLQKVSHQRTRIRLPVKEFCYLRTINLTAAVYFLSFKEAAANKKLLDHNLKEKRVQRQS